jgi:acetyl esterase/lipase
MRLPMDADRLARRSLLRGAIGLGVALPFLTPARLLAEAAHDPYLALVHPELRAIAPMILQFGKAAPPLNRDNLAKARQPNLMANRPPLETVPHERRVIPVGKGQPEVAIYIVNAKPGANRPAILHTHGGGFVTGSAESSVRQLQDLCVKLDCVVVSVEYRLAPETTFAGSIEDNYAGLKWLHANAAELGADPDRIAVMGESAGGGHAALLTLTARERGEVPIAFQCLIYPMLDDRTGALGPLGRKMPPQVGRLIWTAEQNRFGWESFLGTAPVERFAPAGAVPARVADLAGLPPAFIAVGTLDLFCDEDIDYARRLTDAGVSTELIVVPGGFHGFDVIALMAQAPLGAWFEQTKLNALRRAFGMAAI